MKKECRTTAHINTTLSDSSLTSSLISEPGNIHSYFKKEAFTLTIVTVSGILYNVGLLAGPYFQGKLLDSLHDNKPLSTVITVALIFIAFIIATQVFRSVKRFYVRRFANNTLKSMRTVLYHAILSKQLRELEQENTGSLMAKATGDVDACVEGMRKFTTEIFDTGVFMVSYLVMMFTYDVKLTLVATVFIALALFVAELVKKPVYSLTSAWRKSASELNGRTYELTDAAMMYRIYGRDKSNAESYDKLLSQYSKKAVKATVSENAMEPLYSIIVMAASVFIIVFGAKNVTSSFWTIGRFSAYLSLFAGLAGKASHAGKLFNSVQKATVSWKRIKPYLSQASDNNTSSIFSTISSSRSECTTPIAEIRDVSFSFKDKPALFSNVSFACNPGTITGITGPVACGKSVFAHLFLGSDGPQSYDGSSLTGTISIYGKKIETLSAAERAGTIGVMFHDSALFSGTIYDNITIGREPSAISADTQTLITDDAIVNSEKQVMNKDTVLYTHDTVLQALNTVCFDKDIAEMKEGLQTVVGNGGIRLSGGQQSRIALARALYGKPSLLILDDPFAAVDPATERQILFNIRALQEKQKAEGSIPFAAVLISHRLQVFNSLDSVILFNEGNSAPQSGTHDELLSSSALYRSLCAEQEVTE